jgi:hypothetical protein
MSEVSILPASVLKPLDPDLRPEVRVWVDELRGVWQAAGLSMGQFAVLHPFDKGTISRYLSGHRVPGERHFLDTLLTTLETYGRPVTPPVREYLTGLQMRALEAAHPHEYRVRLVKDELEVALTGRLEAERYARVLEEQLADHRCAELEAVLDLIDQAYSDEDEDADAPAAIPSADWGSIASRVLPVDDPYAVADFLSLLDRLRLRDHAGRLADRVVAHFSDRRRSPDGIVKQDGLLPLLATMNRLKLYDQADRLSTLLGYTSNRYLRRNAPAVEGRFS